MAESAEAVLSKAPWPVDTRAGGRVNRLMLRARLPARQAVPGVTDADHATAVSVIKYVASFGGAVGELLDQLGDGVWKPPGATGCDLARVRQLLPLLAEEGVGDLDYVKHAFSSE